MSVLCTSKSISRKRRTRVNIQNVRFPQIIVDGEKIGGFTEFKALVEASK